MWVYRNLCTCCALPVEDGLGERLILIKNLHPEMYLVLNEIPVVNWITEECLIHDCQSVMRWGKRFTETRIIEALIVLLEGGMIERVFIPGLPEIACGSQPPAESQIELKPYWCRFQT